MKNIVIFGDTGFIGRHLVRRLTSSKNYNVIGFSRTPKFDGKNYKHYSHNIFDVAEILTEFTNTKNKIDALIYLVGLTKHEDIVGQKDLMLRLQTQGILNAVKLAEITECKKFIYLSSGKVYGKSSEDGLLTESKNIFPTTFLGVCKRMAEEILVNAHHSGTVVARLFNAYGPEQPEGYLIPTVIKNAVETGEVNLETLEPMRDYVYIEDVCSAIEIFLMFPTLAIEITNRIATTVGNITPHVVNISTGIGTSVGTIVAHTAKILNKKIKVTCNKEKRFNETPIEIGIPSDCLTLRGWKPRSIEEGLKLTIEEFQKCKNWKN